MNKRVEAYEEARAAYFESVTNSNEALDETLVRREALNEAESQLTIEDRELITELREEG